MSKHTAGPWTVDTTNALGAYGVWTEYAHPQNPGHDGAGYQVQICSVTCGEWVKNIKDGPIPRDERDANARLIAASPILLAEAEKLLALMDSVEIDSRLGDETDRVFPRYEFEGLRAAVSAARGVQPPEVPDPTKRAK